MAIPTCKSELEEAIQTRFDKLAAALDAVPVELADDESMEGHAKNTMMSVSDLVAYLVGWNELVLKWLDRDDRGRPVDFPETGYRWNELGALAQKFYGDYADLDFPEKRARLVRAKDRLLDEIAKRSDDELYGTPWHGKWTKGRMIQFNSSSPYENARARVRRWLKAGVGRSRGKGTENRS